MHDGLKLLLMDEAGLSQLDSSDYFCLKSMMARYMNSKFPYLWIIEPTCSILFILHTYSQPKISPLLILLLPNFIPVASPDLAFIQAI